MGHHQSRTLLLVSTSLTVLLAAAAHAQEANPADPQNVEEVVVTGSRIARRDYVSESPIVTVAGAQLQKSGSVTVEDALNQMPQFIATSNSATNFGSNRGQANANLRGLGPKRTLVLLDGRRMQPSGDDGSVDLNTIPSALIDSVEVITGGASALYGSDAVAGVINFKLKKDFSGIEVSAQAGQTERGDGANYDVSVLAGGDLADGRGNGVVGVTYSQRDQAIGADRPFFAVSTLSGFLPQGVMRPTGSNLPSQAAIDAVFAKYGVPAGTVRNTNTFGFNSDGTLFSVNGPAVNSTDNLGALQVVANNTYFYNAGNVFYVQIPLTRYALFSRFDYEISPHVNAYVQGTYTNYTAKLNLAPAVVGASGPSVTVPANNPFIPADLRAVLASRPNPNAPFLLTKRTNELGVRDEVDSYDVYQLVLGLSGDVPGKDWTWDAYISRGRAQLAQTIDGYGSTAAYVTVLNAADGGTSICTGGYNPFGLTTLSDSCLAYLERTIHNTTSQTQTDVQATAQGGLFQLPAGELRFAVGAEYRRNEYTSSPDAALRSGDIFSYSISVPSRGRIIASELYGELLVPLLADVPFVESLNLDVAYRYSDYNTVGSVSTYKASLDWRTADWLLLRGSYQRAIRAPNLAELYTSAAQSSATFPAIGPIGTGDPCDTRTAYRAAGYAGAAQVRALCLAQGVPSQVIDTFTFPAITLRTEVSGNRDLDPETADTFTGGVVMRSPFDHPLISGATLSVDYYNIKLKKAIGQITAVQTLAKCFNADGTNPSYDPTNFFCGLITRNPGSGELTTVATPLVNLGGYRTDGIDVQFDWKAELADFGLPVGGDVSLNVVTSYLRTFEIQTLPASPFFDYAGTIGNTQIDRNADTLPTWKTVTTFGYASGPVSTSLRWRHTSSMSAASNVGTTGTASGVKARDYFDLDMSWKVREDLKVQAGIINLGDTDPPQFGTNPGATSVSSYDVLGRRYYVRLTAHF